MMGVFEYSLARPGFPVSNIAPSLKQNAFKQDLQHTTIFTFTFFEYLSTQSLNNMTHQILDSVLDAVGSTPLIRLNRIAQAEGLQCNLRMSRQHFLAPA